MGASAWTPVSADAAGWTPIPPDPPPADTRNAIQKSFDANTQTSPSDSLLATGLKSVAGAIGSSFVHPMDTLTGMAHAVAHPIDQAHQEVNQLYADKAAGGTGYAATKFAGQALGAVALGEAMGAGVKLAAPVVGDAATDFTQAAKDRLYPTPKSVPDAEMAARKLGKALVVPTQAIPNFVSAATNEAGTILDYAKRTGIKINSTIDLAKAAKGAADEVQGFYNDNVLKPNADLTVDTGKMDYRGKTTGDSGNRATVSQVNDRINEISQELSPNYRKALQVQTNAANVSDADLLAEKRTLTGTLHQVLADATGVEPQDIADLRQRAGKLRTIADETNLSANTDTTAAGKSARGRSDIPTGTKLGIVEHGIQMLRGGPEIVGNRAVKGALSDISPANTPFPNVNSPDFVAQRQAVAATNQTAAQQEFLKSNQLEQGAQDASSTRAQAVEPLRGQAKWADLGAAKLKDHIARNASGSSVGDYLTSSDVDALRNTPQGKSLLIKAGDLSSGSAAMKNLVKDIQLFRSR